MDLYRISRKYARITVTATLSDGQPATLTGVDIALLPPRPLTAPATPTAATTWTPSNYAAGVVTVLLAGPDADPTGALVVPAAGADLWIRVTDTPEVDAVRVDRINVD